METEARITSRFGWGLTSKLEKVGLQRFREHLLKSREAMVYVLDRIIGKCSTA